MMKRVLGFMVALIFLFATLAGCSAASKTSDAVSTESVPRGDYDDSVAYGDLKVRFNSSVNVQKDEANYQGASDTNSGIQVKEDIKKIIKNGNISVEVKDVDASYEGIMEIVQSLGGEEFNKSYNISGEYKRMELVLKIPPENLNLFQDKITEYVGAGKVRNINIRSSDITSEYYDYTARLESYQASRAQMMELLKKAQNIDETLRIQAEITHLQADIDSMQGQIRMWDKLITMATITLNIDQEDSPFKTATKVSWKFNSFNEIWSTMKNGFIEVVNTVYSLVIWVVIAIVSLSPVIIIVGIILYVILYIKRKRKNRNIQG